MIPLTTVLIYILVTFLLGAVGLALWYLTKEKREMPLPNETDLGLVQIPLPNGIEEGRLTTARKTFERDFETAISNCDDENESKALQETRNELLKYNLFAFKGGGEKYLFYSNSNILDERFTIPMGRDKRFINVSDLVDRGEHGDFHIVFLKMPDPEQSHIKISERQVLTVIGEGVKYLKSAALNTEKIAGMKKMRDFYKEEASIARKETSELRSKAERMSRALSMKSLTSGEQPRVAGALRSRIAEFFYSGYRILFAVGGFGLTYLIWQQTNLTQDPIYASFVVALVVFWVYPHIAERFK